MSRLTMGNIFADAKPPATGERFELILERDGLQIERILSSETPAPGTYVQAHDEWVVLLRGAALLEIEGEAVALGPGDHVHLPAGMAHTVRRTAAGTLWLAVHLAAKP